MSNSSDSSQAFDKATNVVSLHQIKEGKVVALPVDYEGKEFVYSIRPSGGINSTVEDMAHYLIMLLNSGQYKGKRVISSDNLHYLWSPKTPMPEVAGRWNFYALGWVVTQDEPAPLVWHNGETLGNKTMVALMPEQKIGIVILSNLRGTDLPEALALQFFDLYLNNPDRDWNTKMLQMKQQQLHTLADAAQEERSGILNRDKKISASLGAPLPLDSYSGRYTNPIYEEVEIRVADKGLEMVIGPQKTRMSMEPLFRDIFRLRWAAAGDDLDITNDKVHFVVDVEGEAKLLYIEFFKDAAGGLFKKMSS